jgi:hypothetical protein
MTTRYGKRVGVGAFVLSLIMTAAACSDGTPSAPPCVGQGQGGPCTVPEDCKPVGTCKCVDGTDTAVAKACINGACDSRTNCEVQCRTHFGLDTFAICS